MSYAPSLRWLEAADRYRRRVLPVTMTIPPRWQSPQEVAVHEAGHAVTATALGELPCAVSIDPAYAKGAAGIVVFGTAAPAAGSISLSEPQKPLDRPAMPALGADAICLAAPYLAGYQAENVSFSGASPGGDVVDRGRHDELAAHRVLSVAFTVAERRYAYGAAFTLAGDILRAHWGDVERVALALLLHRTLAGEALAALLAPVRLREEEAISGQQGEPGPDSDAMVVRRLFRAAAESERPRYHDFSGRGGG